MLMHGNNYGQIQFDAPHQHVRLQKSVRLSVRLSLCGIVSKRKLNACIIELFHHLVGQSFYLCTLVLRISKFQG